MLQELPEISGSSFTVFRLGGPQDLHTHIACFVASPFVYPSVAGRESGIDQAVESGEPPLNPFW
jgi:hypothetical protein